jgi:hypothetical protein
MGVLREEPELFAIGNQHLALARSANEVSGDAEPAAIFDQRMFAMRAFKGEGHVG